MIIPLSNAATLLFLYYFCPGLMLFLGIKKPLLARVEVLVIKVGKAIV
jgi:hypothetical protein